MITRFKHKLRMTGFEDRLQQELGLTAETSAWVSRLARNCAGDNGVDILAARGDLLADALFRHLEGSGYAGLLEKLAGESRVFADRLANYRSATLASAA
jgi:hypothetical protein